MDWPVRSSSRGMGIYSHGAQPGLCPEDYQQCDHISKHTHGPADPKSNRGRYDSDGDFFFSAARLRELKEVITASRKAEKQAESKAWILTHDALVSLLWCCITQTWKDSNYFERDSNPLPPAPPAATNVLANHTTHKRSGLLHRW